MSTLPKGWEELSIGEVILPFKSIDPTKEPSKEFRYIDIGSIDNSRQVITDPKDFQGKRRALTSEASRTRWRCSLFDR
jgi:type I restriction enzyme, S subunit